MAMAKEEHEGMIKNTKKIKKENAVPKSRRVIITVYIERSSSSMARHRQQQQQEQRTCESKFDSILRRHHSNGGSCYDRRAQLLAYARQLRAMAAAKRPSSPVGGLKWQRKNWGSQNKLSTAGGFSWMRLKLLETSATSRRRRTHGNKYERIESAAAIKNGKPATVIKEERSRRKPQIKQQDPSNFCVGRKLKGLLKKISCKE